MNDERLRRMLEAADEPMNPPPEFSTDLLDELKEELGFRASSPGSRFRPRRTANRRSTSRRWLGLLVAAMLVTGAIGASLATGALHLPSPHASADALSAIRSRGLIRVAVRPDQPQVTVSGQTAVGFDVDVAKELARRLGVQVSPVVLDVRTMLAGDSTAWDIALPSIASNAVDPAAFAATQPYYYWPHPVIVVASSDLTDVIGLLGRRVCAVSGDAGAQWLQGRPFGSSGTGVTIVERTTDGECVSALVSGAADAMVASQLLPPDIAARGGLRVLAGGPDPEPRVVVGRRSSDTSALVTTLDGLLSRMQADGSLRSLSESRFGGEDLTRP